MLVEETSERWMP